MCKIRKYSTTDMKVVISIANTNDEVSSYNHHHYKIRWNRVPRYHLILNTCCWLYYYIPCTQRSKVYLCSFRFRNKKSFTNHLTEKKLVIGCVIAYENFFPPNDLNYLECIINCRFYSNFFVSMTAM